MKPVRVPSRLLTPESLQGSPGGDLTLGITRDALLTSVGLHRFEPVYQAGSLPLRAMLLTRQGISLGFILNVSKEAGLYLN